MKCLKSRLTIGIGVLALGLTAAACSGSSAPANSGSSSNAGGKDFTIGFAIGLSGAYKPFDVPAFNSAKLAIKKLNDGGGLLGRQIKVVTADNRSDPSQSAAAGQQVLSDGAQMVVVSCDYDLGGPAALAAQGKGILSFSTCAGSTLFGPTGVGNLAFTMGTLGLAEGAADAEWATKNKSAKTAFVLADPSISFSKQVCQGFTARFEQLNGKGSVLGQQTVKIGSQLFNSQVSAILAHGHPDVVAVCMVTSPSQVELLKEIRAAGIKAPIVGCESLDGDFWLKSVPHLSDVYYTTHGSLFGDDPSSGVNDAVQQYKQTYGAMTASAGLTGTQLIDVWSQAVKQANSFDGASVAKTLEGFKDVQTVLGPVTFTSQYHINVRQQMRIMQIQDGKPSLLTTWTPSTVPLLTSSNS